MRFLHDIFRSVVWMSALLNSVAHKIYKYFSRGERNCENGFFRLQNFD